MIKKEKNPNKIIFVHYCPDKRTIAAGCRNGSIKLWNIDRGCRELSSSEHPSRVLKSHDGAVICLKFSLDSNYLFSGSYDNNACVWSMYEESDFPTYVLKHSKDSTTNDDVTSIDAITDDDGLTYIVTGNRNNTVNLWSAKTGFLLHTYKGHYLSVYSVHFHPNGECIVSAGKDKAVRVWQVMTNEFSNKSDGHTNTIFSVKLYEDGTMITASRDHTVRFWSLESRNPKNVFYIHNKTTNHAVLHPKRPQIATTSRDYTAKIWGIKSNEQIQVVQKISESGKEWTKCVDFSPCGTKLVVANNNDQLRLYRLIESEYILDKIIENKDADGFTYVQFHPKGEYIVSGCHNKLIQLWCLKTGDSIVNFSGHTAKVDSVQFSPDGEMLVSASHDKTVRVWGLCFDRGQLTGSSEKIMILKGHVENVWCAVFGPNSKKVYSASADTTVRIWDVKTGECLNIIKHPVPVRTLDLKLIDKTTRLVVGDFNGGLYNYISSNKLSKNRNSFLLAWSTNDLSSRTKESSDTINGSCV